MGDASPLQASRRLSAEQPYRVTFWCVAAVAGFLQVWSHRFDVNPDGVTYMQMAWTTVRIGLIGVVDGHRSPFYPWLLSVVFRVLLPRPRWESTAAHLVDFFIYLISVACFEVFLRELLRLRAAGPAPGGDRVHLPERTLWLWGYVFFLWASAEWLTPAVLTPDLCIAALTYLATALLLRMRRGSDSWSTYILFGAVLGLGFLAKAFMFLVGWVFLACSLFAVRSARRGLPRAAGATAVFLLIAAPQILALSHLEGHWTFSDSGAFNYAWFVDRIPPIYWQGGPPPAGAPVHPQRKLTDHPASYEFPVAPDGTFHPAGDPSYWYAGVHPYFQWPGQLRVLGNSAGFYVQMMSRTGALYAAFLVLFLLLRKSGRWGIRAALKQWPVWLPCYAALGLFAMVLVEARYVGSFVLMLLMALFALLEPDRQRLESRLSLVTVAAISLAAAVVVWSAGREALSIAFPSPAPQFLVAGSLESMNLLQGPSTDFVTTDVAPRAYAATIGAMDSYWAHLGGVRLIAAVPDGQEFWQADAGTESRVLDALAGAGVQFVVARVPSPSGEMRGWQWVPGTEVYIHRLAGAASAADLPAASARPSSSRDTSR